jgi:outer membrane protein
MAKVMDVLQADVAAEAAAFDLEVAMAQARVDRVALAAAIGRTDLMESGADAIDVTGTLNIAPANVDEDLDAHPGLRAAQLDVEGGRANVLRAERSLLPTIDGSASAGASLVAITKPDANFTPSAGVGLSLAWPLLDLGRNADVRAAAASAIVADKTRQATLVQLTGEQRRANTQLQVQTSLVARAERLVASARQAQEVVGDRLSMGAARLSELLDAQGALAQAEATLVSARVQRAAAVIDVVAASGVVDGASFVVDSAVAPPPVVDPGADATTAP